MRGLLTKDSGHPHARPIAGAAIRSSLATESTGAWQREDWRFAGFDGGRGCRTTERAPNERRSTGHEGLGGNRRRCIFRRSARSGRRCRKSRFDPERSCDADAPRTLERRGRACGSRRARAGSHRSRFRGSTSQGSIRTGSPRRSGLEQTRRASWPSSGPSIGCHGTRTRTAAGMRGRRGMPMAHRLRATTTSPCTVRPEKPVLGNAPTGRPIPRSRD